jgi:hypothetical protein
VLLPGSNQAWNSWYFNRNGIVVILKIDGKKVTKLDEVDEDTKKGIRVVKTGKSLKLPGQPASMRGRNQ